MKSVGKNVLALVVGIFVGGSINIALVSLGHVVIPLPDGVDVSTPAGMREGIKLFEPLDFLFPFLAHALGTLVGAFLAFRIAATHALNLALGIGGFFLLGGIAAVVLFGGPIWFAVADLILAYLPMGYLGGRMGRSKTNLP